MTFEELTLEISHNVWPEGEARNLRPLHKNLIRDGLIDLQKKIPCLQSQNIEYVRHGATFFSCGASAFGAPNGYIQSLRTIPDLLTTYDWRQCDSVWAQPQSRQEFECILANAAQCGESLTNCSCTYPIVMPLGYYCVGYGETYPYPELPLGLMYADATTDKPCRARERWFAMYNCYIYTYPVIQSNEVIILEWHGIKRTWNDEDVIPYVDESDEVNRQIVMALEYFVACEHTLRIDCDDAKSQLQRARYNQLVAEMIVECKDSQRLPSRHHCFVDCNC